ncbi:MAG TPA: YoaK family protein [Stellaceae bacterium]|jgi:uncharacterized membrane protein YoaK (UPF0700 family)|nr:YoaK family protein [Stellaceae bacterium]
MLLAALLAAIAGYVDAICYLRLGGAFAANMTGNLVRMGITTAEGNWLEAAWCASVLAAFLAGVLLARLVFQAHSSPRLALMIEAGMVATAGTGILGDVAIPLLAAAMAMQNEAVSHGVVAINVAFITGDLQKLGEQLVAETVPEQNRAGGKRIILTVLISYAAGAAVGTLAARWNAASLFLPVVCLVGAAALRPGPRRAASEPH